MESIIRKGVNKKKTMAGRKDWNHLGLRFFGLLMMKYSINLKMY